MIKKIDDVFENISKWGIVVCVSIMLLLTLLNIVLRWFELSLHWIEPLVRHTVFLAAFLGGSLATSSKNHIKIDILTRVLESAKKENLIVWIDRIIVLVTLISTVVLANAAVNFAKIEFEFGKEAFLGVHSGFLVSIIPFGMGLISARLILRFLLSFKKEEV